MNAIRQSTALLGSLYCSAIAFTSSVVYSFSSLYPHIPMQTGYGVALVILAFASLLTGLTAPGSEQLMHRAVQLCLIPVWGSLGIYHIVQGLEANLSPVDALVPGTISLLLVFVQFIIIASLQKDLVVVILSLCMSLSCVFEVASIWRPLKTSVGSYYILLVILMIFCICKKLVDKKNDSWQRASVGKTSSNTEIIICDFVVVGQAGNCICAAIFASQVSNVTTLPSHAYMWVIVSAIVQIIVGVVSVRRKSIFYGCLFCFYGAYWLNIGYTLAVNLYTGLGNEPLLAVQACLVIVHITIAILSVTQELFITFQNVAFAIFSIAVCINDPATTFLGVAAWILFGVAFYGIVAYTSAVSTLLKKVPLGTKLLEAAQIRNYIFKKSRVMHGFLFGKQKTKKEPNTFLSMLGYSKYANFDAVGFLANSVTCLSVLWVPTNSDLLILPWVIGIGGMLQMSVGIISFTRGKTFEGCAFTVFSSLWMIWGTARSMGTYVNDADVAGCAGLIGFLAAGFLLWLLSAMVNKAWFVLTFLFELVCVAFVLESIQVTTRDSYEIVVMIVFALVNLYTFSATALHELRGRKVLPMGTPVINISHLHAYGATVTWAKAKKASGVIAIADIMNRGGICGIPSDVVYVLVAACKFPRAVERAYKTKKQAKERPMSMWISRIEQLSAARAEFGELLWAFMSEVWPSTISIVVNKGSWIQSLGIGHAEKYIGRPDSIAIRMPDNAITSLLIDKTGPVAVSSANPTGEADTTHHLQVLAKLGPKNCDGILCDGPSHENAASTVVDCRKINDGKLGFFRIGIVPKSRVLEIFENVKRQQLPSSEPIGQRKNVSSTSDTTYKSFEEPEEYNTDSIYLDLEPNVEPDPVVEVLVDNNDSESTSGILNMGFEDSTVDSLYDNSPAHQETESFGLDVITDVMPVANPLKRIFSDRVHRSKSENLAGTGKKIVPNRKQFLAEFRAKLLKNGLTKF